MSFRLSLTTHIQDALRRREALPSDDALARLLDRTPDIVAAELAAMQRDRLILVETRGIHRRILCCRTYTLTGWGLISSSVRAPREGGHPHSRNSSADRAPREGAHEPARQSSPRAAARTLPGCLHGGAPTPGAATVSASSRSADKAGGKMTAPPTGAAPGFSCDAGRIAAEALAESTPGRGAAFARERGRPER